MVKFSKRINTQKKFKNPPSTQVSGMPFKSVSDIARINSVGYNKHGQINPLTARPPAGTGATPIDFPQSNEKPKGAGAVNPFYIWLLDNSITRTTFPINYTDTVPIMAIAPIGENFKIVNGDEFYLYHPITFNSKLFLATGDAGATDTELKISPAQFVKGLDNFPSGSFLVKKYDIVSIHTAVAPVGSSHNYYLAYLGSVNNWYSTSAFNLSLGTSVGTELDSTAIRSCEYIATGNCNAYRVTLAFYTNATADLEFKICRVPLVDDSTSNVTFVQMTHTDNDDTYTLNTNYVKTFDITGGGNLLAGFGVAILCRSTTDSGVRIYGRGYIEII